MTTQNIASSYGFGGLKRILDWKEGEVPQDLVNKILDTNIGSSFTYPFSEDDERIIKVSASLKQQALKYKNPLLR